MAERQGWVQISLQVPKELKDALRVKSILDGESISDGAAQAIADGLYKDPRFKAILEPLSETELLSARKKK